MLQALHIRDLALLSSAEVEFSPGLNVVSGETGGGKSLLVTALKLLRGERASAGLVRHGATELRVDAEFGLGDGERSAAVAAALSESCGIELAPDEGGALLVTRIVDPAGRSKVRINDRPATLAALRSLGGWLLEIHGQDESRALMRPEIQAETLDGFAGSEAQRSLFADCLSRARACRARLDDALSGDRDRLARIEFLRFQLGELDELALQPGELAELERDHALISNLDNMRELLESAVASLQDAEPSASELIARAQRALEEAAEVDPSLAEAAEAVAAASVQVSDACRAAQSGLGRLDLDPARFADLEERLAEVRRALSRFGPGEADLFDSAEQMRVELSQLEDPEQNAEALEAELSEATKALKDAATKLRRARARAVPRLAAAVQRELQDLGMAKTEFRVAMDEAVDVDRMLEEATAHGPSPIDFEVRINPGEPFHSMRETASGGEMARIVLAIKKCLADQDRVPFLAFDEIDAEIGGRLGLAVGSKLREVARHHQVLIVTHLPQVAAFAESHFQVHKREQDGRTCSEVQRLTAGDIERELAAMSAGEGADRGAISEARRLIKKAKEQEAS